MISLAEYWKHDPPSKKKIFTPAYLQCNLCNKFCPNKRGCMIQAYKESYIREKLVNDEFHWWERGFIQAYAQLWFHAHHSANQATRFLIYACPLDPLRETTRLVLDDATKYIVHVALSDGVSDGDHYAIMWFDIAQKKIEVLEGTRDFSGSSRKLRGYTFNRDAFAVLRLCSLVGEDIRNIQFVRMEHPSRPLYLPSDRRMELWSDCMRHYPVSSGFRWWHEGLQQPLWPGSSGPSGK